MTILVSVLMLLLTLKRAATVLLSLTKANLLLTRQEITGLVGFSINDYVPDHCFGANFDVVTHVEIA